MWSEGGHEFGKMGRHRLWMAPNMNFAYHNFFQEPKVALTKELVYLQSKLKFLVGSITKRWGSSSQQGGLAICNDQESINL